jgi:hypothetical protein
MTKFSLLTLGAILAFPILHKVNGDYYKYVLGPLHKLSNLSQVKYLFPVK